jgi:predicted ATPase
VGIVGEPGIGKSRLLSEFRHLVVQQPVTYVEGRCLSYGKVVPYLPVLDVLQDTCGITNADSPAATIARVRAALRGVGLDADEGAPYLLHLLGIATGEDRLAGQTPEALKARTFETLRQMSLRASQQQPLILAVEDLQRGDRTSEEFLTTLVERLSGAGLLLLTTYRPGYRPPWMGKSYTTQLALPPLSHKDSLRVIHSVLHTEQMPSPLAQRILARAEGNPLFVEELAQALVDQDVFGREPDGEAVPVRPWPTRPLFRLHLPPTIQGVLAARIDRLPPEPKTLLHTLAVIGDRVPLRLLTAVVEQPPDELRPLLTQLQVGEFLHERPTLSEPEYTFVTVHVDEARNACSSDSISCTILRLWRHNFRCHKRCGSAYPSRRRSISMPSKRASPCWRPWSSAWRPRSST